MLCCVSRKASASPNNEINQNLQNSQNNKKSILDSVPSSSSSGFSSSSFDSSQVYDSSLTSGFTTSSSSCDTSGFSSNIRVYPNSSSESFSTASQLTDNFVQKDHFLAHSKVFHPVADCSSSGRRGFPPEPPKRLLSFSSTTKSSSDEVGQDSSVEKSAVKDEPTELLPCAICARTFKPQSLEKHTRICERAAIKKRKPFDSAKQRIQGTELAEFLPKETIKRKISQPEERTNSSADKGSWQRTRDELRRAIRAARGETVNPTPQRQVVPTCNVTVGVPTRPNEKGICPTCERQFSIKSYERHVAWCKERATRVPMSAATNIAKERLEARMKYRAPALKNRRVTTREKYSPVSAMNLTSKTNNPTLPSQRAKETVSTPSCNNKGGNENTTSTSQSKKSTVTGRRSGQSREGISSGPMKSRLSDRSSRPSCEIESGTTASNCPSARQNSSRSSNNVFHRLSGRSPTKTNSSKSSNSPIRIGRVIRDNENSTSPFEDIDERGEKIEESGHRSKETVQGSPRNRRHRSNIVHARSYGNPRVNDVTINEAVIGLSVQPCIRKNLENEREGFITWKKIGENNLENIELLKMNSAESSKCKKGAVEFDEIERTDITGKDKFRRDGELSIELENISWASGIQKLDQTYLIKESLEGETDFGNIFGRRKRRPVIDSPRVEFYYDKKTMETHFFGNFELTNIRDEITGKTWMGNKSARRLDEATSHSFSGRPKLEPLNLSMIESEGTTEFDETHRSKKSFKSLRNSSGGKSSKNTVKSKSPFETESSTMNMKNLESGKEKHFDNLLTSETFGDVDLKISQNENIQTSDRSRSLKSIKSSKNDSQKLLTEKTMGMESTNGDEWISERPLSSRIDDDKNCVKKSSEAEINVDETLLNLNTSRSLRHSATWTIIYDDVLENLNRGCCKEKSHQNLTRKKSSKDLDLKIDNDGEIDISSSRSLNEALPTSCEPSKEWFIESAVENQVIKDEQLDCTFNEIDDETKSAFSKVLGQILSLSSINDKDESQKKSIEIFENKICNESIKSDESSMEKNNKKPAESEKVVSNTENETKTIYQRCGTYVIEKPKNSNFSKERRSSDEFLDEKPLEKKRKMETISSTKMSKEVSNSKYSMEKKSIATETEEENSISFDENIVSAPVQSRIDLEITNELEIDKSKNVREIREKYVNRTFTYDSDDTFTDENFLKQYETPSSSEVDKKLSSGIETSFYDFRKKAFSDSCVTRETIPFYDSFLRMQRETEVNYSLEMKRKSTEQNTPENSFLQEWKTDKMKSSSEMRKNPGEEESSDNYFLPEQQKLENSKSFEIREKSREHSARNSSLNEQQQTEVKNPSGIRNKLRKKMKLLRGSTDNLITSIETADNVSSKENCSINFEPRSTRELDDETIHRVDFGSVGKMVESEATFCGFLPEIPIGRIIAKNDNTKIDKKYVPLDPSSLLWQRAMKNSNARLINLDPPTFHRETIPSARLSNIGKLPPVVPLGKEKRSGSCKDYDPFLIAERQMNELLSDTCSDQSLTDSSSNHRGSSSPSLSHFPLSHSSAFVKYPDSVTLQNKKLPEKRVSLIAPPTEFDDLATDFSSDSTETNSISREINGACDGNSRARDNSRENNDKRKNSRDHVLGRRVIIDKSKALGTSETIDDSASIRSSFGNSQTNEKARKLFEKTTPKVSRSNSVRIISSLKAPDAKSNNSVKSSTNKNDASRNNRNNNYASLSGSNVSLSSIVSSENDVKRSNSMFDELASSFEDDISGIYPSLRSLLKNDSLSVTSPAQSNDVRNGQISDDEFSSPDSYKRQEQNKLSADSAYSSLNRKYSNHGRSTNDMAGRHEEDSPLRRRDVDASSVVRSKMSKFCHECGSKFPDTAKFCCECGIRRLAL